jgi:hypothetical protein
MSSRRFAGQIFGAIFSLALGACATAAGSDVDAGRGELPDAAERADADPEEPDAAPKPDAEPEPDAALPDAELPPPPDAPPGTPDAAPLPDAPPCTPTTKNLLVNAGFESGPGGGWSETSAGGFELITSQTGDLPHPAQAGTFAAFVGGYNSTTGTQTDQLLQTVTIPASTTALRIKGFRWVETEESGIGGPFDKLFIELLPATGTGVIETFGAAPSFSNKTTSTDWVAFDLPAAAVHAGETVRFSVRATFDFSDVTNFLVDSLVLEATVCE